MKVPRSTQNNPLEAVDLGQATVIKLLPANSDFLGTGTIKLETLHHCIHRQNNPEPDKARTQRRRKGPRGAAKQDTQACSRKLASSSWSHS